MSKNPPSINDLYYDKTVAGGFENTKSLEAKSHREQRKQERMERREKMRALAEFYETNETQQRAGMTAFYRGLSRSAPGIQKIEKTASKALLRWALIIAGTICFWQFIFGLCSLIGFGIHVTLLQAKSTLIGRIVSFFIDFTKYIPAEFIGMVFWTLATLVGAGGFIGFIIFFYIAGIKMMNSVLSTLILSFCFALTILPVTNMFPWLMLWLLYLNVSLFSKS